MSETSKAGVDPFGDSPEDRLQKRIFVSTFSMISALASADGKISKDEIVIIDRFMKNVLGLDAERRAFASQVFNEARRSDRTFEEYARDYRELLKDKPKMLDWMVDVLIQVSCVDKDFGEAERALVASACEIFGISDARYKELLSKYRKKSSESSDKAEPSLGALAPSTAAATSASSPYAVLKLEASATNEEIQAQCKQLSAEYNPSRMVELGLPEEFVTLAEEKFREIMQAYKALKAERKF